MTRLIQRASDDARFNITSRTRNDATIVQNDSNRRVCATSAPKMCAMRAITNALRGLAIKQLPHARKKKTKQASDRNLPTAESDLAVRPAEQRQAANRSR